MSLLSAALALAGAASSGCDGAGAGEAEAPSLTTEVGAGPCALLECTSRVELVVRPGPPGEPAPERARACVDGRCLDLDLRACGPGRLCEASADGSLSLFVPLSGDALEGSAKHLAALSLEGPAGRAAQAVEFRLIRVEPGGAACGHCYQAKVAFDAPVAVGD